MVGESGKFGKLFVDKLLVVAARVSKRPCSHSTPFLAHRIANDEALMLALIATAFTVDNVFYQL
jgi:hypothetical protein